MNNEKPYLKKYIEKFKKVPNDTFYTGMLDDIKNTYSELSSAEIPALPYSVWKLFYETGSRKEYQTLYYRRRAELCCCTILYLIYEKQEYLTRLEDVIWAVCDEYSWALPAHVDKNAKLGDQQVWIDLFAAETAQALSEIYILLESVLSDLTKDRIKKELEIRIFDSYETHTYWWETGDNNWAAVCGGSVGMAYMYMAPQRFKNIQSRLLQTIQCFLSGYGDDGCCLEGIDYWQYGFGYFVCFADMLKEFTDGEIDLFDTEKVKNIAQFQQNIFLKNNITVSFSDSGRSSMFNAGITHYLAHRYNKVTIPDNKYIQVPSEDSCYRFARIIRDFAWSDSSFKKPMDSVCGITYFENAGWYINKKDRYAFAAKGGNNDEPHNHNDLGSFIIANDKEQLLADIGHGEYTRDYFSQYRYKYLVNSSLGHSVPIIDGHSQNFGADCIGEITKHDGETFSQIIKNAYDVPVEIGRSFKLTDSSVKLSDNFVFSDNAQHSVTERFISLIKPEISDGKVTFGGITLKSDSVPTIKSEDIKGHHSEDITVWLIDYTVGGTFFEIEFVL